MNIPYYQDYQEFFQRQNFEILPKNSVNCNGTMRKSMEIFLPFLRATYFLIFLTTYDFDLKFGDGDGLILFWLSMTLLIHNGLIV